MPSDSAKFSAAVSFIGYVYQCEYPLFRALDTDNTADGVIEDLRTNTQKRLSFSGATSGALDQFMKALFYDRR
ncbi:hypothetical protein KGO5_05353 [Sinorhizobium sp. KGO-5]|nr:hypothetical protein KGO5_05353 [Sinorhizobium sp. KGO-5]